MLLNPLLLPFMRYVFFLLSCLICLVAQAACYSPASLPLLPPSEVTPLLAQDSYWYSRSYGEMTIHKTSHLPAFGFMGYNCISKGCGVWFFVEKQQYVSARFAIAPSFAHSYVEHPFFDFIDTNIRIGVANTHLIDSALFLHIAHAYGMLYWLDLGMFATVYAAPQLTESVLGFYAKADHMINHVSLQVGIDIGLSNYPHVRRCAYVLVEYDGASYDTSWAPVVQWWYQWHTTGQSHANSYAMAGGVNGCWEF